MIPIKRKASPNRRGTSPSRRKGAPGRRMASLNRRKASPSKRKTSPSKGNRKRNNSRIEIVSRASGSALQRLKAVGGSLTGRFKTLRTRAPRQGAGQTEVRGLDVILLSSVLCLLGLGMVMVYSSSAVFASAKYGSSTFFLRRHVIYGALGLIALFVGWRLDFGFYRRWSYPLLLTSLVFLGGLLIPGLGNKVDGATRWFHIAGLSFQPSEVAKFSLVVYLAHSLAQKKDSVRSFSIGFLPHLCVAGLMGLLILRQPDLGTTVILGLVTLLMLVVAGTKLSYVLLAVMAAAPVAYQAIVGTPWRMRRLLAYLDPWAYRQDAGYQISESLISIGSGGLHGLGLGDGKQKLFFLPAAHTDFIFAIVGEELGFVGMAAMVLMFILVVLCGLRAAIVARDQFGTYLAFGITATFGLQALLHMSVVLGLVPTKGITLPLVSYGGTALVMSMFTMGVLLNVAARNPQPASVALAHRRTLPGNRKKQPRVVVAEQ